MSGRIVNLWAYSVSMTQVTLNVDGMTCAACVATVSRAIVEVPGVRAVEVDLEAGAVALRWGAGFGGMAQVAAAIQEAGYEVAGTASQAPTRP